MEIVQINLNGIELRTWPYQFYISGLDDIDKDIVTNDLLNDGQSWGRSKNSPKALSISGYIKSSDNKYRVQLNQALAENKLKSLVLTYSNGEQREGFVELKSKGGDSRNPRKIAMTFTMPDPCWYALDAVSVALGATYSAEKTYPYTYPRTYGAATGGERTITNDGNTDAYPVITIDGTCSNISVTNQTTGESIRVSPTLNEGDELVIDCRPDTCGVYLNGVANIGLKTSPGWIHCPPGDNQFVFARNSLKNKKHCTVQLQSRYM